MKSWTQMKSNGLKMLSTALTTVALMAGTGFVFAHDGQDGGDGDDDHGHGGKPPVVGVLQGYRVTNLVADLDGVALNTDTNLVNPWGLVSGPRGNLIVADNHSGLATVYGPDGTPVGTPIAVYESPTGVTLNHSPDDFLIVDGTNSHPAWLLFATESGKILAWNPKANPSNAVVVADNSTSNAVYKGIALARNRHGAMLYATDFHNGKVDMFDNAFTWTGSFTDTNVDAGFAPFNVQNIGGWLYVTFAKQLGPDNEDDDKGPGNGFIDIFRPDGHLFRRFASHGALNSPWGLAVASDDFGKFRNALLVGNFGDGMINAYSLRTGAWLGHLSDTQGMAIQIEGLWALHFGREIEGDHHDRGDDDNNLLYFTAGPDDENHGVLGLILPTRRFHH